MKIMASMLQLLQMMGVMMMTIDSVDAVICYECSSDVDAGCNPLNPSLFNGRCEGFVCYEIYDTAYYGRTAKRGCEPSWDGRTCHSLVSSPSLNRSYCYCSTDCCNGNGLPSLSPPAGSQYNGPAHCYPSTTSATSSTSGALSVTFSTGTDEISTTPSKPGSWSGTMSADRVIYSKFTMIAIITLIVFMSHAK